MLKMAEKLPPIGLLVAVQFMALRLISACSLSIGIDCNGLVKIAKALDEDDQGDISEDLKE